MHCKKLSNMHPFWSVSLVSARRVCFFFVLLFNETMELNSPFKNVFLSDLWVVNLLI